MCFGNRLHTSEFLLQQKVDGFGFWEFSIEFGQIFNEFLGFSNRNGVGV